MNIFYIIIGVLVVLALYLIYVYNRFVALINRAKEAWADIEVQLKRRYDLIPNLINTVKGYQTHEQQTLQRVTEARTAAMAGGGTVAERNQNENVLSQALKSLFAVAESYPDLKANQNFLELQRELSDTENKIQAARRFYNTNVRDLNIAVESFPGNLIAASFGFGKMELFDLPDASPAQNPVEVKF